MRLEVGAAVDPAPLRLERWFAAKDRTVTSVTVEERFPIFKGGLAILRAGVASGRSDRYSLPVDDDAATWLGLADLAARGGVIDGVAGGTLVGLPPARRAGVTIQPRTIRPLAVDQSNTSVVIGEASMLKLYRRLETGPNPEVELVMALRDAPIPDFEGAIRYRPAGERAVDVAIVQRFVRDAPDEFEQLAERLATWLRAGCPPEDLGPRLAELDDAGRVVAALHVALLGLEAPYLRPRPAKPTDTARWVHRASRALVAAVRAIAPIDHDLAAELRASRPVINAALAPLGEVAAHRTLIRIHGDLSVAQLVRDRSRYRIVDLEGEPTRSVAERRRRDSPVRDLASMLRSIDHITRSAIRRSGINDRETAVDAWLDAARRSFLDAYAAGLATVDRAIDVEPRLLHALEVEKELYEFAYAAMYLPAWRYAPAAGLRWLLERGPDLGRGSGRLR